MKRRSRRYSEEVHQQYFQSRKNQSNDTFDSRMISHSPLHLSKSLFSQSNNSEETEHRSNPNRRFSVKRIHQNEKPIEIGNAWLKPPIYNENTPSNPFNEGNDHLHGKCQINKEKNRLSIKTDQIKVKRISRNEISLMQFEH